MRLVVGMADVRVSKDPQATLITYALGSCLGVTLYDPLARVAGLLHFMLPESRLAPEKAQRNPCIFADTAVPLFFREAYKLGGEKRRMRVTVAGGAQVMDDSGFFNIGRRNYIALRRIFWMNGVLIDAEEIGGSANRTVRLEVLTGRVWVRTSGDGEREL